VQPFLFDMNAIGLAAGGLLALPWLFASRRGVQRLITVLLPFQALLGVGLVGVGLVNGVSMLPKLEEQLHLNEVSAGVNLIVAIVSILLGGLFGVQIIARLFDVNSPKRATAMALAEIVAPYQGMLGLVALAAPLAYFLYRIHLLDWIHA